MISAFLLQRTASLEREEFDRAPLDTKSLSGMYICYGICLLVFFFFSTNCPHLPLAPETNMFIRQGSRIV